MGKEDMQTVFDFGKVKNISIVWDSIFNHNDLDIHRTSLKMTKIWKDCMSSYGAQLLDPAQSWQMLRSDWPVCIRERSFAKGQS